MTFGMITLMMLSTTLRDCKYRKCKDMLQCYLTGQLSSGLGSYQVGALRKEFKSFTDVSKQSMELFKGEINKDMRAVKGYISNLGFLYSLNEKFSDMH